MTSLLHHLYHTLFFLTVTFMPYQVFFDTHKRTHTHAHTHLGSDSQSLGQDFGASGPLISPSLRIQHARFR